MEVSTKQIYDLLPVHFTIIRNWSREREPNLTITLWLLSLWVSKYLNDITFRLKGVGLPRYTFYGGSNSILVHLSYYSKCRFQKTGIWSWMVNRYGYGRWRSWTISRYFPFILLERLSKTMKNSVRICWGVYIEIIWLSTSHESKIVVCKKESKLVYFNFVYNTERKFHAEL